MYRKEVRLLHPRKQAVQLLLSQGYRFHREGANHEIYKHPDTGAIIPLKRHDFNENDLRYILREIRQKEGGRQ